MDQILALGATFTMILGAIAGILGGAFYALYKKVSSARHAGQSYGEILRSQGLFIAVWLCLCFIFLGYLRVQTALRPKNTLDSHNPALQEKLEQVDKHNSSPTSLNAIPGAENDRKAQQNADYSENNERENRQAVEQFQSIQ